MLIILEFLNIPCYWTFTVVARFRHPFLSPLPHDSQVSESLLGSPVADTHRGLAPSDVLHAHRNRVGTNG